jgi:hypothetical protein
MAVPKLPAPGSGGHPANVRRTITHELLERLAGIHDPRHLLRVGAAEHCTRLTRTPSAQSRVIRNERRNRWAGCHQNGHSSMRTLQRAARDNRVERQPARHRELRLSRSWPRGPRHGHASLVHGARGELGGELHDAFSASKRGLVMAASGTGRHGPLCGSCAARPARFLSLPPARPGAGLLRSAFQPAATRSRPRFRVRKGANREAAADRRWREPSRCSGSQKGRRQCRAHAGATGGSSAPGRAWRRSSWRSG